MCLVLVLVLCKATVPIASNTVYLINPNVVRRSYEEVINMTNHSPDNGIACHGKVADEKHYSQ